MKKDLTPDTSILIDEYIEHSYIANRTNNYLPKRLIVGQIDFSKIELKIYEMFVNQINYTNIDPKCGLLVKIPISYFKEFMTKNQIEIATKKMSEKSMTLYDVNNPQSEFKHLPIFRGIYYNPNQSGYLEFRSNPEISEYLILGTNYAKYNLQTILNFKHSYSIILYKLLKIHMGQNRYNFIYSVEDLRKLLNIPKNTYKNFGMFKERVLDPAIKEIADSTTHPINCSYENKGSKQRYVTHLEFKIRTVLDDINQDKDDFLDAATLNPTVVTQSVEQILIKEFNLKTKHLNQILSSSELINKFVTLYIEFNNGLYPKVKNRTAYILTCLGLVEKKK